MVRKPIFQNVDVHVGSADAPPIDWRKEPDDEGDRDDDAPLAETPRYVIEQLGFDPKELDDL
jgi:hypothetical protein